MVHKKKDSEFGFPMVGGSSLLVIFAVLTLTIFALLSLSTVRAEERLSTASAQAVADYYAADCAAQEMLARFLAGEQVEGIKEENGIYCYRCDISERQALEVVFRLEDTGGSTVLRWQAVPQGEWEPDTDLPVWDGTTEGEKTRLW